MDRTQDLLRYVFQTENEMTIPISGTGTAAMEAAVANIIELGDAVLACVNGYFGGRIAEMAKRYGADVRTITRPWGEVFSAEEVDAALKARPAKIVTVVHAETSTGALQPLDAISEVVHRHGALFLVDAVTSLGGLPVRADESGSILLTAGRRKSNRHTRGQPDHLWARAVEKITARKTAATNWYLDMSLLMKYWGEPPKGYHHTAPISAFYALYEALRIATEEGLENRWARHRRNAEMLWQGIEELGLEMHVPLENRIPSLTTVRIPEGVDDLAIRKALLNDYNIEISGGFAELAGKVWRIGTMGYSSRPENVLLLLAALKKLLSC